MGRGLRAVGALLLLLFVQQAVEATVTFYAQNYYFGTDDCSTTRGGRMSRLIVAESTRCISDWSRCDNDGVCPPVHRSSIYNVFNWQFTRFEQAPNCTGPSATNGVSLFCSSTTANREIDASYSVSKDHAYNVTYYFDSNCTQGGYLYRSSDNLGVVAGVLDECTLSVNQTGPLNGQRMVRLNSTHLRWSYWVMDNLCMSPPSTNMTIPLGACVRAPMLDSGNSINTPYMMVTNVSRPTQPPIYPKFYLGQIDLNMEASELNAQIVGASVGILCGFTAMLVGISITGILS
jgi:hypothetical protein